MELIFNPIWLYVSRTYFLSFVTFSGTKNYHKISTHKKHNTVCSVRLLKGKYSYKENKGKLITHSLTVCKRNYVIWSFITTRLNVSHNSTCEKKNLPCAGESRMLNPGFDWIYLNLHKNNNL